MSAVVEITYLRQNRLNTPILVKPDKSVAREAVNQRLINWGRWTRSVERDNSCSLPNSLHPIFNAMKNYAPLPDVGTWEPKTEFWDGMPDPIDELDARKMDAKSKRLLCDSDRKLIKWLYIDGHAQAFIAKSLLNCTPRTVRNRIARIKDELG